MIRTGLLALSLLALGAAGPVREPVCGGPCEGCSFVFEGIPASLGSTARIAPAGAPGEPMTIEGTVLDARGKPAAGIVVYAYHTDARGIYPGRAEGQPHGALRGWARTDTLGRYRFETIRPAPYPQGRIPAHVHMHVIEPGRCTYVIDDILFEDDPLLTKEERGHLQGRGGAGLVRPRGDARAGWTVTRNIRLGENVPDDPTP